MSRPRNDPPEISALTCREHGYSFGQVRAYPQTCRSCGLYTHCPACFAEHRCGDGEKR
jgi:hypothetical protein